VVSQYRMQHEELIHDFSNRNALLVSIQRDYAEKQDEIIRLSEELAELTEKRKKLSAEVDDYSRLRDSIANELVIKREDEEKISNSLTTLLERLQNSKQSQMKQEEGERELQKRLAETITTFITELQTQQTQLIKLREQSLEYEKESANLQRKINDATLRLSHLETTIDARNREKESIEHQIGENRVLESVSAEKLRKTRLLLSEKKNKATEAASFLNEFASSRIRLESELTQYIHDLRDEIDMLRSSKSELLDELDSLQTRVEELSTKAVKENELLAHVRAEIAGLTIRKNEFAQEISRMVSLEKSLRNRLAVAGNQ